MTLIAAFISDGIPVVLGDLVISGPERTDAKLGLPTVGELTNVFPVGSGWSITHIRQKVAVLSDDLVVAWAGNVVAARTLIEELRSRLTKGRMSLDSLNVFLKKEAFEITGSLKASLVGFLREGDHIIPFGHNAFKFTTPNFGEVIAQGSGMESIEKALRRFPESLGVRRGDPNALGRALGKSLILTGTLLQMETATYENLMSFYGGGYEIGYFNGERFSKLEEITYLFWYAEIQNEEPRVKLFLPPYHFMKLSYKGDTLIIRTITGQPDQKASPPAADRPTSTVEIPLSITDSTYLISPIYSAPSEKGFDLRNRPSMKSPILCNYVLFKNFSGEPEISCRVDFDRGGSNVFEESPDKPNMEFRLDFVQQLVSEVLSSIKE